MKKIKDILYELFIFLFMLFGLWATADAQTYKQEGNTFSSVKTTKNAISDKTPYVWKDSKDKEYPIYISQSGSCYVIRVSSKTGKEYKYYLPVEVSKRICSALGREYKSRTKQ